MAHISEYRKLSSKLETLKEKLVFQHELYELDKVLINEKYLKKLEKFKEKENVRLSLIAFAFADLEEEVNKRIANKMRKYNVKDYWLRRETIQIYRQDTGNGFEAYKAKLDELSDAVIAIAGGYGTLEELSELIVQKQLGYNNKPIVILNTDGFYDNLISFFETIISRNFANEDSRKLYFVAKTPIEAIEYIKNYKPEDIGSKFVKAKF